VVCCGVEHGCISYHVILLVVPGCWHTLGTLITLRLEVALWLSFINASVTWTGSNMYCERIT